LLFRYFKQSAATFFGLDESREGELKQRWEDRRRRLVERRCGTLRESSTNLIDVRTISTLLLLSSLLSDDEPAMIAASDKEQRKIRYYRFGG